MTIENGSGNQQEPFDEGFDYPPIRQTPGQPEKKPIWPTIRITRRSMYILFPLACGVPALLLAFFHVLNPPDIIPTPTITPNIQATNAMGTAMKDYLNILDMTNTAEAVATKMHSTREPEFFPTETPIDIIP